MRLAGRTSRIASSQTMKVSATVDRLRREGVEVIDLGAGEPDFNTPALISAAGHVAIDENFTKYTPVTGVFELKRAVCERYRLDYGVDYSESEVIITAGGKQALYNTALSLFGPGDEVTTTPFTFVATVAAIRYAGATPIFVDIEPDYFTIDPSKIDAAITRRTRAIIPVHLYGQPADMTPILEMARGRHVTVIEDAAQAHGSEYHGRRCGSLSEVAAFSFYPGKNQIGRAHV